jgi:Peptidase family C25/Secretion system C-terminal sorting domain
MKYKIFILTFFNFFIFTLFAQNSETKTHELSWKGVEKWTVNSSSIDVISFDGAQFPYENRLPYFNQRITVDKAFSYKVEVTNPVYIQLSSAEKGIAEVNKIPSELDVKTDFLTNRGSNLMDIKVLPFVIHDGQIMKLKSFDLSIIKAPQSQKVATTTRHTYASNSVLSQGKFVKIRITNSGIYKLTYENLVSMGIDPSNVRVFGYGGAMLEQSFLLDKPDDLPEASIWMEKGSDGVFNAGDYILFYAQGINKWAYDKTKSMFTHIINPYSKYGYYFVSSDAGVGKKISPQTVVLPDSPIIENVEEFLDYQVAEKDLVNLTNSGKEFYGEEFKDVTSYDFNFNFPNPVSGNTTYVRLDVASSASVATTFNLSLNGVQSKVLTVPMRTVGDNYEQGKGTSAIYTYSPLGDNFAFKLSYDKSTSNTSVGYLNFLEVNARRQLKMSGSVMPFQNVDNLGMGSYNQYLLSNANANVQIWDLTDPVNITSMQTQSINGKLAFVASNNDLKRYVAIDPTASSDFPIPVIESEVPNQNLHALAPVDMVILTHPNFVAQAQTLAQAHRDKDNLTVAVVTTDQVYNEFSSGAPDATAYRWVMKMLYDRALNSDNTEDLPKYLLLFGRGSYDNRKILSNSGDNYILTYQAENSLVLTLSYTTDDYFTFLDDNEGTQVPSHLMDIGVGRFPVTNVQQATDVVNKTIGYMNNTNKGNWKNQVCFLADDGDGALHMKQADSIAVSVSRLFPSYEVNKIYLDAYLQEVTASGQSYPLAKSKFQNLLRSGLMLLNYTGHAGPSGWANENILSIADVKSLSNKYLPLFFGATCDFLQFDVLTVSGGEQVVLNPSGGGIGIISAARPVYASQNLTIDKLFCENLFKKNLNGTTPRIGDVIKYAKNNVGTEINKLSYIFMGDPALKLNYPNKYQVVTNKVNESVVLGNDTLRALSVATIQGYIADEKGVKVDNFNGKIHSVVYDKVQRITTLNNEGDGALTYSDRPNTLFSGDAEVVNGAYSFSFMLPKDIKYNFGGGRINYYAQDDINDFEAQGYFENFYVGGTNKTIDNELDGPTVQLYLNTENFVSGDKVNETPLFIANISDVSGINTVGSGIGHDVMMTIDIDPNQSYVLNDYFQASANSYKDGVVKYKLAEMANGKHTLTFRVWDLLNNSSTKTIEFEVVKGLTPVVFSVSNYPNPVKSKTQITIKHDRPDTVLSTTVEIFDLTGRKIWSFSQSSADNIEWDLTASDGIKVKTGIYLYRVNVKTANSDVFSKTNKMIVVEQ